MLPVQILINNFLYDTSQVTLPSDNVDASYIERPKRWNLKMIYRYMLSLWHYKLGFLILLPFGFCINISLLMRRNSEQAGLWNHWLRKYWLCL